MMSMRLSISIFVILALCVPSQAVDLVACQAASQRYNKYYKQLYAQPFSKRAPYCKAMAPEVGFAACEEFIQSGFGNDQQRNWAKSVSDALAQAYGHCTAQ